MSDSGETVVYTPDQDFHITVMNHSDVIYRYLQTQNSSTITPTQGLSGPSSIVFPPQPEILDQSSLNFTLGFTASGTASWYTYIQANLLTVLGRVRFFDQFTGQSWVDIMSFNNYAVMVVPASTKLNDFLTKSYYGAINASTYTPTVPQTTQTSALLYTVEEIGRFYSVPNFSAIATTGTLSASPVCGSVFNTPNWAFQGLQAIATGTYCMIDMNLHDAGTGRRQFYVSASNAAAWIDVSIPFRAFKFTALSYPKEIYNPSNMQLDIYWNSTDNFAFYAYQPPYQGLNVVGTNYTGAIATAAFLNNASSCASILANGTITNISVTVACENNQVLAQKTLARTTQGGVAFPIPWVQVLKTTVSSSNAHNYQLPLTATFGQTLLAIITAPFSTLTSGATSYAANVHTRDALATYNTYLNGVSINNPQGFNVLACNDYLVGNRKLLRGSSIQTLGQYIYSDWIHIDSWFGCRPICEVDPFAVDGMDLRKASLVWSISANLGSGQSQSYSWCNVMIGQKILSITSQGSQVF